MTDTPKYVLFATSLLGQLPPGEETLVSVARIFSDFHERIIAISLAPFPGPRRREMLNAAGEELLKELQELCDTESDEPTKLDVSQ